MHAAVVLLLPLLVQAFAYAVVFLAAQGGGSFMGLLAMPVAALSLVVLLAHGIAALRTPDAWLAAAGRGLAIAVLPPLGLLLMRLLES